MGEQAEVGDAEALAEPEVARGGAMLERVEEQLEAPPAGVGSGAPDIAGDKGLDDAATGGGADHAADKPWRAAEQVVAHGVPVAVVGPASSDDEAAEAGVRELLRTAELPLVTERTVRLQQIVMERGETLLNVVDLAHGEARQLRLDRVLAARVEAQERGPAPVVKRRRAG